MKTRNIQIQVYPRSKDPQDCAVTAVNSMTSFVCHLVFDPKLVESWGDSPDYASRGAKSAFDSKRVPLNKRWERHKLLFTMDFIRQYMKLKKQFPPDGFNFVFETEPDKEALSIPHFRKIFINNYFAKT